MALLEKAAAHNVWDLGNQVLYDLCERYPDHRRDDEIIAKIWLIGRAYAAAVERRRVAGPFSGDSFYEKTVVKAFEDNAVDDWFRDIRAYRDNDREPLLKIHGRLTALFKGVSGLDKISLASKYLHFHFPDRFYIYDSRALAAANALMQKIPPRSKPHVEGVNRAYAKFFVQCESLAHQAMIMRGKPYSPRDLDKVFLMWSSDGAQRSSASV